MANPEHLEILKQGVERWNEWRKVNRDVKPDLIKVNFEGADFSKIDLQDARLYEANFIGANLSGANMSGTVLVGADLIGAKMKNANLVGSYLFETDLSSVDLVGADFFGANLSDSSLSGADLMMASMQYTKLHNVSLNRTDLSEIIVGGTVFANLDFSTVKRFDGIRHEGPSTIGIDTLYKSRGKIPEVFLRGCGLPEQMIEYARVLTANPIDFYSCFISYSTKDDAFAQRLHADLQVKGVRCWFAPHDLQSGKKVHDQIDEAIRVYDKLLLILSENSMSSNWVGTEIIKAKKKENKRGTQMLFPIGIVPFKHIQEWEFFDSDSGRDLAREIREYHIPDFSMWKTHHDAYKTAFVRLLRDLKA